MSWIGYNGTADTAVWMWMRLEPYADSCCDVVVAYLKEPTGLKCDQLADVHVCGCWCSPRLSVVWLLVQWCLNKGRYVQISSNKRVFVSEFTLSPVYTIQPVVKPVVKLIWQPVNVRIHDTTGSQTGCIVYTAGCQTGWTNSGCSFNTVVKPVVKPFWQPAVSCIRTFNRLSNRLYNWFDNWLYRANGVLERPMFGWKETAQKSHTVKYGSRYILQWCIT